MKICQKLIFFRHAVLVLTGWYRIHDTIQSRNLKNNILNIFNLKLKEGIYFCLDRFIDIYSFNVQANRI